MLSPNLLPGLAHSGHSELLGGESKEAEDKEADPGQADGVDGVEVGHLNIGVPKGDLDLMLLLGTVDLVLCY